MHFLGNRNLHMLYNDFLKLLFVPFIRFFCASRYSHYYHGYFFFYGVISVSYPLTFLPCKLRVSAGIFNFKLFFLNLFSVCNLKTYNFLFLSYPEETFTRVYKVIKSCHFKKIKHFFTKIKDRFFFHFNEK